MSPKVFGRSTLFRVCEIDFLIGQTVVEVRYDDRIVFDAGGKPEPRLYADVGNAVCLDAERKPLALSELVGRTVAEASTNEGTLGLAFADGVTLRTPPNPQYEAWQVVGGSPQHLVVCLPGGELAVWDKRHVPSEAEADEVVERLQDLFGWRVRVSEITDEGGIIVEPEESDAETDL